MRQSMTISLPPDLNRDLNRLIKDDGVTRSDIIRESLREYLLIRKFRRLRAKMLPKAQARGIFTDEDVFDLVS